ncbi:MAG: TetR/AcrR family transcriptional regulator [Myxococcota bacterium]
MGKREENRKRRAEDLLRAGLSLFLARGIEPVSIDDLTREAGMAKGNFYRYFPGKGELVEALLAPMAGAARTAMRRCAIAVGKAEDRPGLLEAYSRLALDLASLGLAERDRVRLYLQEKRAPATPATATIRTLSDEMDTGAIALTDMAIGRQLLRVRDPRVSALAVVGAVESLTLAYLSGRLDAPPAEVAQIVVAMVMEGLAG